MKSSKKLLSLFLAVVMVFSVATVMASAYTVGPEVAGDINYKYTVEKVDKVPETAAGSAEYTADNIYAVTAWMQSNDPVVQFTVPFHFDKTKFSPIMLFDGDVTYPHGAGFGVDDYYANMNEGAIYAYSLGDYMNNTGMYKANGTEATTKALAKCIGLGNENSAGMDITTELVSPDHPLYNKWGADLPADTGVMYANVNLSGKAKSAYLNTIEGINSTKDWIKVFTVYFETITEDDVTGAEFGVYTDNCFTVDGVTDLAGYGYFVSATTSIVGNPNKNVVENAKITGPSVVVSHEGTQSKWKNGTPVIEDYLFGFVGSFTGLEVLTEKDDATGKNEVTNIASIVAVATLASGGNASSTVNTIWKSGDKYMFRAAFEGFDPTGDEVVSVEFTVTMKDGATYKTDAASTKAVKDIYAASVALNPGLTPLA